MKNTVKYALDNIVHLSEKRLEWVKEETVTKLSWNFQEQIN